MHVSLVSNCLVFLKSSVCVCVCVWVCGCVCVCVLSHVQLFVTSWTVARQAPLSTGFSRQEYWSGLPSSTPGDLPNPGKTCVSHISWVDRQILYHCATWEAQKAYYFFIITAIPWYLQRIGSRTPIDTKICGYYDVTQ